MSFKLGHVSIPKRRIFLPLFLLCAYDSSVLHNFKIFLLTNLFSIKKNYFFIISSFFLLLTCSCQYSYDLMLTSNCMCRHCRPSSNNKTLNARLLCRDTSLSQELHYCSYCRPYIQYNTNISLQLMGHCACYIAYIRMQLLLCQWYD
jgi:hypothetical protein